MYVLHTSGKPHVAYFTFSGLIALNFVKIFFFSLNPLLHKQIHGGTLKLISAKSFKKANKVRKAK
jgi:hypothetical protein